MTVHSTLQSLPRYYFKGLSVHQEPLTGIQKEEQLSQIWMLALDTFWVPKRQNKKKDHFSYWHCALVEMAKADFSKKNPLVPKGRFFSGKDSFRGPEENFWKSLVWPFQPVHKSQCQQEKWSCFLFYLFGTQKVSYAGIHIQKSCSLMQLLKYFNLIVCRQAKKTSTAEGKLLLHL